MKKFLSSLFFCAFLALHPLIVCLAWNSEGNLGAPLLRSPEDVYATEINALNRRCRFSYTPLREAWPSATAHWFSNKGYDLFNGTDFTPWNHQNFPVNSGWRKTRPVEAESSTLLYSLCELREPDRSQWNVIRVGPFRTHGGYDWTQFEGHNVFELADEVRRHGTLQILEHYAVAVDEQSGKPFGYPPIHVHHVHAVPRKRYLRYQWPFGQMSFSEFLSKPLQISSYVAYLPNYVFEGHGEWDPCAIRQDVEGCYADKVFPGYAKEISTSLDLEGEYNDGRAHGSPTLEWYIEMGIRWQPKSRDLAPLSHLVLTEAHALIFFGYQSTYENYYYAKTEIKEGISWYSGRVPISGKLVRAKHHNHMSLLNRTFLIAASEEELGLDQFRSRLRPDGAATFSPVLSLAEISEIGETHDEVYKYLIGQLRMNGKSEKHIICEVEAGLDMIDGILWDRFAKRDKCNFWNFKKGDIFTSVAFHTYRGGPPGPWAKEAPEFLPMHNQWNIMFESDDRQSHYLIYSCLEYFLYQSGKFLKSIYVSEMLLKHHWITPRSYDMLQIFMFSSVFISCAVGAATIFKHFVGKFSQEPKQD